MTISMINETQTVTLNEAIQLIVHNPNVRFMLRGEPGLERLVLLTK